MARRSPKTLLALLLGAGALALGFAAFALFGDHRSLRGDGARGDGAPASAEATDEGERSKVLPEPQVAFGGGTDPSATTVLWPVRVDLDLVEARYLPREPGLAPLGSGATARLTGYVLGPGRGGEDAGAQATVRFVAGPNAGRVLHTDAEGQYGASDLFPGLNLVEIRGPGLIGARREVRLRQGKETLLNVPFGRPGALEGSVQDKEGEPLEGAQIVVDGRPVVSGPDGSFYAGPIAAGQVLVEVSHPGYADYQELVWIASGQVAPSNTVTFHLERAATLELALEGDVGGPGPALVYLLPGQPARRVHSESYYRNVRYPFHRKNPIEVWPGVPATITGLPAEVVRVHVFRPGAEVTPRHVNLIAARPTELSLRLKAAPLLHGRVLRDGEPVAGARVTLEPPNRPRALLGYLREGSHFLEAAVMPDFPPARQVATTDARGRFQFTAYEQTSPTRYLAAEGPPGSDRIEWAGRLVHRGEREVDPELTAREEPDSELSLEFPGRVQGLPVEVWIDGSPKGTQVLPRDEPLTLTTLLAGRWRLRITWRGQDIAEETLEVARRRRERFDLPPGCIEGQDEETWRRAGKVFPR